MIGESHEQIVSLINLVMVVGFAVDYSAHIADAFWRATGSSAPPPCAHYLDTVTLTPTLTLTRKRDSPHASGAVVII